jgi:hypothetical protein
MEQLRLAKSIRRVILLAHDEAGQAAPVVVYERGRKKKPQTRLFRPLEQVVRRAASAQAAFADSYVSRHRDSNTKARDGWIRDLNRNVARATRRGVKRARVFRP